MRIDRRGRVTIPRDILERAGLSPGSEVEFLLGDDGEARLVRSDRQPSEPPLRRTIERLRGKADTAMSTEEIMALMRG